MKISKFNKKIEICFGIFNKLLVELKILFFIFNAMDAINFSNFQIRRGVPVYCLQNVVQIEAHNSMTIELGIYMYITSMFK